MSTKTFALIIAMLFVGFALEWVSPKVRASDALSGTKWTRFNDYAKAWEGFAFFDDGRFLYLNHVNTDEGGDPGTYKLSEDTVVMTQTYEDGTKQTYAKGKINGNKITVTFYFEYYGQGTNPLDVVIVKEYTKSKSN